MQIRLDERHLCLLLFLFLGGGRVEIHVEILRKPHKSAWQEDGAEE